MIMENFQLVHLLICSTVLLSSMATAGTIAPSLAASRNAFAGDLLRVIAAESTQTNVVYSPASIQSCAALAYFGAKGSTAEELRKGLKLGAGDRVVVAENYGEFLQSAFKSTAKGPTLRMANRIYVNDKLEVKPEFNSIAAKYFDSQAEQMHFADSVTAVNKINNWVEQQTEHKITNLLTADAVNADTSAVVVNAIYFKALWAKQFSQLSTHKAEFSINANSKVRVDMMALDDSFKFAELPDLKATALELPYENSDISMLIVLPKELDGLKELERKLESVDLNELTAKMQFEDVDVFLPKFRIEFDIDLKQPMNKLGMKTMFSDEADFSDLFTSPTPQKISEMVHKAYLDVNEAGSEAAAATFMKIVPMSLNVQQKVFRADHPFVFAIRSPHAVYFAGHVAKF